MSNTVKNAVKTLVENNEFTNKVEELLRDVMKDGKIDMTDTLSVILLVIECQNNIKSVKVKYNQIPEFVKSVMEHILNTNDLIPENQEEMFIKLIDSGIKLVMIQPRIKNWCLSKLPCCQ